MKNKNLVKIIRIKRNVIDGFDFGDDLRLPITGNQYFLYETNNISCRTNKVDFFYSDNPYWIENGMSGNMDSSVTRYHGWRGTTGDIATYALGVHVFLGVEKTIYSNTIKYKLTFGPDLKFNQK